MSSTIQTSRGTNSLQAVPYTCTKFVKMSHLTCDQKDFCSCLLSSSSNARSLLYSYRILSCCPSKSHPPGYAPACQDLLMVPSVEKESARQRLRRAGSSFSCDGENDCFGRFETVDLMSFAASGVGVGFQLIGQRNGDYRRPGARSPNYFTNSHEKDAPESK